MLARIFSPEKPFTGKVLAQLLSQVSRFAIFSQKTEEFAFLKKIFMQSLRCNAVHTISHQTTGLTPKH